VPCHEKPSSSTCTSWLRPRHSRINRVPGFSRGYILTRPVCCSSSAIWRSWRCKLQTRPTRGDFLHPVGHGTHQQLTAEARRGLGFVELVPQLTKLGEVEVGEARQRLRAAFVVSTRHNRSPVAGWLNGSKPIDRPVISVLAARHLAAGPAQPGDGGSHSMR